MLEFLQIRNLWYDVLDIGLQILTVWEGAGERAESFVLGQWHLTEASIFLLRISPQGVVFQLDFLQKQTIGECVTLSACA